MNREGTRQQLLLRGESLRKRLDRVRSDRRRSRGPLSQDFSEQAVERENDETLDFIDERTRAEIEEIEQALRRVDDASYGVCQSCGDSISERRLDLVPTATVCALCAAHDRTESSG